MKLHRCLTLAFVVAMAAAPMRASADEEETPRDHTYSLAVGYYGMRLTTTEGLDMGMHGPAISAHYFVGRRMGFMLRGAMEFPIGGRQTLNGDTESFNLRAMYESFRLNFDGLFMFGYRARPTPNLDLVLGIGIHFQTFRLVSARYNPIEGILGGFGGVVRLERRFGTRFFYGGELAFGVDPLDFVKHQNRITLSVPMAASFTVGVRR